MNERDCDTCVWCGANGCTTWDCEYVSRAAIHKLYDAIKAEFLSREKGSEPEY